MREGACGWQRELVHGSEDGGRPALLTAQPTPPTPPRGPGHLLALGAEAGPGPVRARRQIAHHVAPDPASASPTHRTAALPAANTDLGGLPALPPRPVPGRVPTARPPGSAERGSEISPRISARIGSCLTPSPNWSASLLYVTITGQIRGPLKGAGRRGPERRDLRPGGAGVRGSRSGGGAGRARSRGAGEGRRG